MKLFLDSKARRFVKSAASNVALDRLVLKRRDQVPIEIVFVENGVAITPPAGTTAAIGLKAKFSDSNFLAYAAPGQTILDLHTIPVEAAFSSDQAAISALLEIRWGAPGTALRTATLQVELQNSVITGDEGTPSAMPDGKATQAQAEAGTDNDAWMTPLRTAQAIEALAQPAYFGTSAPPEGSNYKFWVNTSTGRQFALIGDQWIETSGSSTGSLGGGTGGGGGGGVTSYNDLTDLPTLGTAASTAASDYATAAQGAKADTASQPGHTHAIADTPGLQAALDAKQPAGSYAPATGISPSAIAGTAVITTDSRLSDARTPTAHQHAIADVTNLSSSLAAKITGAGVAAMQVVTALPASPVPTTFYIVIPSGATTASAVTLGSVPLFTGSGGGGGGGDTLDGGGGGEPEFTPATLSSLALWLDATTGLYDSTSGGALVTANGSAIGRWEDRSSNARHFVQSTVNSRPVLATSSLNAKSTITFDGTDDFLDGLYSRSYPAQTLFVVFSISASKTQAGIFAESIAGATDQANYLAATQKTLQVGATANGSATLLSPQNITLSSFAIGTYTHTGTQIINYLNGTAAAAAADTFPAANYEVVRARLGGRINANGTNAAGQNLPGSIAEVIAYDRLLTTAERQQVESYLGTKWGITL